MPTRSSKPASPPPAPKATRAPAKARAKPRRRSSPRVSAKSVRLALQAHGGNVSAVADAFDVGRQTVYNWIKRYALRDLVELSRDTMFATAEANINLAVQAGDIDASKFVLTHMPTEGRWSSKTDVSVSPLGIPPEIKKMLDDMGLAVDDVGTAFNEMICAEHERFLREKVASDG